MSKFFYDTKSRTFIELKAKENPKTATNIHRSLTTDSKPTRSRYEEEGFVNEFSGQIPDFYNLDTLPGRRDDEEGDKKIERARQETIDRISRNGNQNTKTVNSDVMGNPSPQKLLTQDNNDELELARQEIVNRISRNARR